MKVVIQRVKEAKVEVENKVVGKIEKWIFSISWNYSHRYEGASC